LRPDYNFYLISGAVGSGAAAILHFGCIIFGGDWYRFFGAGEKMALLAEAGSPIPTRITGVIILVLLVWTYLALAGMGMLPKPPLLRYLLAGIALIYLIRALSVFWLIEVMRGNSISFWFFSSLICLILGISYLVGAMKIWNSL
jgi:hypothetical protein